MILRVKDTTIKDNDIIYNKDGVVTKGLSDKYLMVLTKIFSTDTNAYENVIYYKKITSDNQTFTCQDIFGADSEKKLSESDKVWVEQTDGQRITRAKLATFERHKHSFTTAVSSR